MAVPTAIALVTAAAAGFAGSKLSGMLSVTPDEEVPMAEAVKDSAEAIFQADTAKQETAPVEATPISAEPAIEVPSGNLEPVNIPTQLIPEGPPVLPGVSSADVPRPPDLPIPSVEQAGGAVGNPPWGEITGELEVPGSQTVGNVVQSIKTAINPKNLQISLTSINEQLETARYSYYTLTERISKLAEFYRKILEKYSIIESDYESYRLQSDAAKRRIAKMREGKKGKDDPEIKKLNDEIQKAQKDKNDAKKAELEKKKKDLLEKDESSFEDEVKFIDGKFKEFNKNQLLEKNKLDEIKLQKEKVEYEVSEARKKIPELEEKIKTLTKQSDEILKQIERVNQKPVEYPADWDIRRGRYAEAVKSFTIAENRVKAFYSENILPLQYDLEKDSKLEALKPRLDGLNQKLKLAQIELQRARVGLTAAVKTREVQANSVFSDFVESMKELLGAEYDKQTLSPAYTDLTNALNLSKLAEKKSIQDTANMYYEMASLSNPSDFLRNLDTFLTFFKKIQGEPVLQTRGFGSPTSKVREGNVLVSDLVRDFLLRLGDSYTVGSDAAGDSELNRIKAGVKSKVETFTNEQLGRISDGLVNVKNARAEAKKIDTGKTYKSVVELENILKALFGNRPNPEQKCVTILPESTYNAFAKNIFDNSGNQVGILDVLKRESAARQAFFEDIGFTKLSTYRDVEYVKGLVHEERLRAEAAVPRDNAKVSLLTDEDTFLDTSATTAINSEELAEARQDAINKGVNLARDAPTPEEITSAKDDAVRAVSKDVAISPIITALITKALPRGGLPGGAGLEVYTRANNLRAQAEPLVIAANKLTVFTPITQTGVAQYQALVNAFNPLVGLLDDEIRFPDVVAGKNYDTQGFQDVFAKVSASYVMARNLAERIPLYKDAYAVSKVALLTELALKDANNAEFDPSKFKRLVTDYKQKRSTLSEKAVLTARAVAQFNIDLYGYAFALFLDDMGESIKATAASKRSAAPAARAPPAAAPAAPAPTPAEVILYETVRDIIDSTPQIKSDTERVRSEAKKAVDRYHAELAHAYAKSLNMAPNFVPFFVINSKYGVPIRLETASNRCILPSNIGAGDTQIANITAIFKALSNTLLLSRSGNAFQNLVAELENKKLIRPGVEPIKVVHKLDDIGIEGAEGLVATYVSSDENNLVEVLLSFISEKFRSIPYNQTIAGRDSRVQDAREAYASAAKVEIMKEPAFKAIKDMTPENFFEAAAATYRQNFVIIKRGSGGVITKTPINYSSAPGTKTGTVLQVGSVFYPVRYGYVDLAPENRVEYGGALNWPKVHKTLAWRRTKPTRYTRRKI